VFIELVDQLRCVRPHEDGWLVASAGRMNGRDVMEGELGCPICRARYPVRAGAVYFDGAFDAASDAASDGEADAAPDAAANALHRPAEPAAEELLRTAALLGLAEPGGFVLLGGEWGDYGGPLAAAAGVQMVLLNPAAAVRAGGGVSVVHAPWGTFPLAAQSLRAAALGGDEARAPELAARVVNALQARGRLVAPATARLPADVVELARDGRHWVAERSGVTSAPVPLGLARRGR
jgi:hypothetical protein